MFTFIRQTKPARKARPRRAASWKPRLEVLEDRTLLSGLIYDNGPIRTDGGANSLSGGWQETDSFVVSGTKTLTRAQVALWATGGETPVSLGWSIGTTQFGSDVASGVASSLTRLC